jgi:coproporphyrinogen III oxidase
MKAKEISDAFRACQQFITKELEEWDGGASFQEDAWEREEGGGGYTRNIKDGTII